MVSETGNGVRLGDIPGPRHQLAFPAFSHVRGGQWRQPPNITLCHFLKRKNRLQISSILIGASQHQADMHIYRFIFGACPAYRLLYGRLSIGYSEPCTQ